MASDIDDIINTDMLAENISNSILEAMADLDISRAELARRMGVSRAHVTQLFKTGNENWTLDTIAKMTHAIGYFPRFAIVDDTGDTVWSVYA